MRNAVRRRRLFQMHVAVHLSADFVVQDLELDFAGTLSQRGQCISKFG